MKIAIYNATLDLIGYTTVDCRGKKYLSFYRIKPSKLSRWYNTYDPLSSLDMDRVDIPVQYPYGYELPPILQWFGPKSKLRGIRGITLFR